jgi:hypothetical protein
VATVVENLQDLCVDEVIEQFAHSRNLSDRARRHPALPDAMPSPESIEFGTGAGLILARLGARGPIGAE